MTLTSPPPLPTPPTLPVPPPKRRVSLWLRLLLMFLWLNTAALTTYIINPLFKAIGQMFGSDKSSATLIFDILSTTYVIFWIAMFLVIYQWRTKRPPMPKIWHWIYGSIWLFLLFAVLIFITIDTANRTRLDGFDVFIGFTGMLGILALIIGWLIYVGMSRQRKLKQLNRLDLPSPVEKFYSFAFAKENLYKTGIFILGLIIMICVLIITIILLF